MAARDGTADRRDPTMRGVCASTRQRRGSRDTSRSARCRRRVALENWARRWSFELAPGLKRTERHEERPRRQKQRGEILDGRPSKKTASSRCACSTRGSDESRSKYHAPCGAGLDWNDRRSDTGYCARHAQAPDLGLRPSACDPGRICMRARAMSDGNGEQARNIRAWRKGCQ